MNLWIAISLSDFIPAVLLGVFFGGCMYAYYRLHKLQLDNQLLQARREREALATRESEEINRVLELKHKEFEEWKATNTQRQSAYDLFARPERQTNGLQIWNEGPNTFVVHCPSGRLYTFRTMEDADAFAQGYCIQKIRLVKAGVDTGEITDMTQESQNVLISDHPAAPTVQFHEGDRQMMVRALAINSLVDPGFEYCSREIAKKLLAEEMLDEFRRVLNDRFNPQYCRLAAVPPIQPHTVSERDGLLADPQPE